MNNKKNVYLTLSRLAMRAMLQAVQVLRNGDTLIKSGDIVFVFSKRYMADAQTISV